MRIYRPDESEPERPTINVRTNLDTGTGYTGRVSANHKTKMGHLGNTAEEVVKTLKRWQEELEVDSIIIDTDGVTKPSEGVPDLKDAEKIRELFAAINEHDDNDAKQISDNTAA